MNEAVQEKFLRRELHATLFSKDVFFFSTHKSAISVSASESNTIKIFQYFDTKIATYASFVSELNY
jgi:hypothetical protein